MSRILTGRGTSLSWASAVPTLPSGITSPIVDIQSFGFNDSEEFSEFLDGLARVNSHYKSTRETTIEVETSDINVAQGIPLGTAFTDLKLVVEGAVESTGVATNNNYEIELDRAVLAERGPLEHDNTDSAPSTVSLTFTLSRAASAGADPDVDKATAAGEG